MMFATTSTRWCLGRSFLLMALLRAGRQAIPSLVSVALGLLMMNFISENESELPKAFEACTVLISAVQARGTESDFADSH